MEKETLILSSSNVNNNFLNGTDQKLAHADANFSEELILTDMAQLAASDNLKDTQENQIMCNKNDEVVTGMEIVLEEVSLLYTWEIEIPKLL